MGYFLDFRDGPASSVFEMTPETAVEFFKAKGLRPTFHYLDMIREEHDAAFTVAKMLQTDLLDTTRKAVETAIEEGWSIGRFRQELTPTLKSAGWWGKSDLISPLGQIVQDAQLGSAHRLNTIYRSNLQNAYSVGQWERIQEDADRAPWLMYDAVDDHRTREGHADLDETVLPVNDPFWSRFMPPNGYNCFPAGQLVSGTMEIGLKSWYSGPAVELTTRQGRNLTLTANHPVMTPGGWVSAGEMAEGDSLLAYSGEVERTILRSVDYKQAPTPSEEVFEALRNQGIPRARVRTTSDLDLYGDAAFGDGYIDIVGADRILTGTTETRAGQRVKDDGLAAPDPLSEADVVRPGALGSFGKASLATSGGSPGGGALPFDGRPVAPDGVPLDPLLLRPGSNHNTVANEQPANSVPTDRPTFGDALDAFSGDVAIDEVASVRRFVLRDHVYDFQTDTGFILASGIVTSNCRCGVIQLRTEDLERMGLQPTRRPRVELVDWTNPRTGKVEKIPAAIDPGWDHNPGKDRLTSLRKLGREKIEALPPTWQYPEKDLLPAREFFEGDSTEMLWHQAAFDDAPRPLKQAVQNADRIGVQQTKGAGAWAQSGKLIEMGSYNTDDPHGRGVWRHEFGHILDQQLGRLAGHIYVSGLDDFKNARAEDAKTMALAAGKGRRSKALEKRQAEREAEYEAVRQSAVDTKGSAFVEDLRARAERSGVDYDDFIEAMRRETMIFDEIDRVEDLGAGARNRLASTLHSLERGDPEKFVGGLLYHDLDHTSFRLKRQAYKRAEVLGSLSDLAGATTKNKVNSYKAGYPGHSDSYYRGNPFAQGTEAFANITSLMGHALAFWHIVARKMAPAQVAEWEKLINQIGGEDE